MAAEEPAADDKVVGDGDGVGAGDGLGDSVKVGLGDGLGDCVEVGLGDSVVVGVKVGAAGPIGDRVEPGVPAVDVGAVVSGRIGDRVGLGLVAVVSGRIGDRVGLGIVAVRVGGELAERDGVTDGSSGEPFPPHEMSNSAATVRPTARIASRRVTAVSNSALVAMSLSEQRSCGSRAWRYIRFPRPRPRSAPRRRR